jgi:hypothetical protein
MQVVLATNKLLVDSQTLVSSHEGVIMDLQAALSVEERRRLDDDGKYASVLASARAEAAVAQANEVKMREESAISIKAVTEDFERFREISRSETQRIFDNAAQQIAHERSSWESRVQQLQATVQAQTANAMQDYDHKVSSWSQERQQLLEAKLKLETDMANNSAAYATSLEQKSLVFAQEIARITTENSESRANLTLEHSKALTHLQESHEQELAGVSSNLEEKIQNLTNLLQDAITKHSELQMQQTSAAAQITQLQDANALLRKRHEEECQMFIEQAESRLQQEQTKHKVEVTMMRNMNEHVLQGLRLNPELALADQNTGGASPLRTPRDGTDSFSEENIVARIKSAYDAMINSLPADVIPKSAVVLKELHDTSVDALLRHQDNQLLALQKKHDVCMHDQARDFATKERQFRQESNDSIFALQTTIQTREMELQQRYGAAMDALRKQLGDVKTELSTVVEQYEGKLRQEVEAHSHTKQSMAKAHADETRHLHQHNETKIHHSRQELQLELEQLRISSAAREAALKLEAQQEREHAHAEAQQLRSMMERSTSVAQNVLELQQQHGEALERMKRQHVQTVQAITSAYEKSIVDVKEAAKREVASSKVATEGISHTSCTKSSAGNQAAERPTACRETTQRGYDCADKKEVARNGSHFPSQSRQNADGRLL